MAGLLVLQQITARAAFGTRRAPLCEFRTTHRLLSSSFLGVPYRILHMNHKKELLRSLWVVLNFDAGAPHETLQALKSHSCKKGVQLLSVGAIHPYSIP